MDSGPLLRREDYVAEIKNCIREAAALGQIGAAKKLAKLLTQTGEVVPEDLASLLTGSRTNMALAHSGARNIARLRQVWGLTPAQFQEMLDDHGGACPVCQVQFTVAGAFMPVIDHDHETRHIRGLLCSRCNVGLGAIGDSLDAANRLVEYLMRRFSEPQWWHKLKQPARDKTPCNVFA